jgi:lipopolysaccharide export system protein LptA
VGKTSCRYVGRCGWKVLPYVLAYVCSIGISLPPSLAAPLAVDSPGEKANSPLLYSIVQNTERGSPTTSLSTPRGAIELNAEQQEFDNINQVIIASGKVTLRFNNALLRADKLRVNLNTKIAIAEGNVSLIRGQQILYGKQFEYNFQDDKGSITQARGDIYQPTLVNDLNSIPNTAVSTPAGEKTFTEPTLSDRLVKNQPLTTITNTSSIGTAIGSDRNIETRPVFKSSGSINRLRFQADKVDFVGEQITAEKVRLTNDPFSPPELEIKADRIQFKTVNTEEDEVTLSSPQVLLGGNLNLPVVKDRFVLNKLGKDTNPLDIGYDGDERGGVYIERSLYPIFNRDLRLTVTPQYFIQRAITQLKPIDTSVFGVRTKLEANITPSTILQASAALTGISTNNLSENLRAKAVVTQNFGLFNYPHSFAAEATYRDRVFNNSLGLQDVQSTIGGVLSSSIIPISNTGINFNYQIGAQSINANTDRANLLSTPRANDLVTLTRYQAAGNLTRSFRLWEGQGLPADNKEAYNYSPVPVVPYLQLNTGIQGSVAGYSSGDNLSSMGYNIGIQGQIGNFTRSSFDYTGFNLNYFQRFQGTESPFLFDRIVDNKILSAGILQQVSGPFRLGIQASVNLDTGKQISTDYYLEYSRRTYNAILRYNPTLSLVTIGFRLNDFNWDGVTSEF